jgi:hypothetical protein
VLKVASGDPGLIADQIPVDIVVDTTLVATAHYNKSDSLNVCLFSLNDSRLFIAQQVL